MGADSIADKRRRDLSKYFASFNLKHLFAAIAVFAVYLNAATWRLRCAEREWKLEQAAMAQLPQPDHAPKRERYIPIWIRPIVVVDGARWFERVVEIQLGYLELTDEDIVPLRFLTHLRTLGLDGNRIGNGAVLQLSKLPELESLALASTDVTDDGLDALPGLSKLQAIWLDGDPITDEGLRRLASMKNLQSLGLCGTAVTDAGIALLAGADRSRFQMIFLDRTPITDASLKSLSTCRRLRKLGLDDTAVTDKGVELLTRCVELESLSLSRVTVSDELIEKLLRLPKMVNLTAGWQQYRTGRMPATLPQHDEDGP